MRRVRNLFLRSTLRTQITVAFLAVALLSLGLLAFLYTRTTRAALTGEANQTLFAAASRTAASLDAFISVNLQAVRAEAVLPEVVAYLSLAADQRPGSVEEAKAQGTLYTLMKKKDWFYISSYALLDHQGRNIMDLFPADIGQDESDRDYFQVPLQTGRPYMSSVEFAQTVGGVYFYFSSPVRNEVGQIVGVLRVRHSVTPLQELISESQGLAGDGSFAILLDENHVRLAHGTTPELIFRTVVPLDPDRVTELRAAGRLPNLPAEELSTNLPAFEQGLNNAADQPFFVAEAHAGGTGLEQMAVVKLENQPWLVVFVQSQEVFLAPIEGAIRATLVWAVIIAGLVVIAAIVVAQWLTGPVIRLIAVAEQITAGDLTVQARVESSDEIGKLALAFNSMTAQLRQMLEGLKQRNEQLYQRIMERKRGQERIERLNRLQEDLLGPGSLDEKLKRITGGVVEIFDADFARIWITQPGDLCDSGCIHAEVTEGPHVCRYRDRCLHLMASSGRYTHIDGEMHRRVPFGCYKIGRVAVGEDPKFITNDVTHDPRVHDRGWAREIGLVSFAGYRLFSAAGEPIGVLALFSKDAIASDGDALLEGLANTAAQVIQTARVEEALREAHEQLDATLNALPDLLFEVDRHGRIYDFRAPRPELLYTSPQEFLGQAMSQVLPQEAASIITDAIEQAVETGRHVGAVYPLGTPAGAGWFELSIAAKGDPKTPEGRLIVLVRDITERKRAEEELRKHRDHLEELVAERTAELRRANERLRRLAQQVISAQEKERQRLSRELHDEAGQALTALKISQELIKADLPARSGSLYQRLAEAIALTDATMEQMRLLAQDLRPPTLDAVGLNPTLEGFCRDFARRTQLSIDYLGAELPVLPEAVNICLYRFLQEALNNVAKHARANQVRVALSYEAAMVSLLVEDDGQGFDKQSMLSASRRPMDAGLGLLGMQERLDLVGGWLEVESHPGQGTHLTAHIPCEEVK
jgi:signal transduction histidine kinase/HAMP domain-containing protein